MWHTSVRYTFLKLLLMTHFVLCEEFDIALLMEKLENLADKIETRTKTKHEDIESVIAKLENLIKTTLDLFPSDGLKSDQCKDECREKIETVKKKIITDFIQELIQAVNEEKAQNLQLRDELRDFTQEFTTEIPGADSVLFSYRLMSLESQLEKLDSKFDSYLNTLRISESHLQSGFAENDSAKEITKELCSTNEQRKELINVQIPVNDTVKVLKAEILAVIQEIDFTVKAIHTKTVLLSQSDRNHGITQEFQINSLLDSNVLNKALQEPFTPKYFQHSHKYLNYKLYT